MLACHLHLERLNLGKNNVSDRRQSSMASSTMEVITSRFLSSAHEVMDLQPLRER